MAIASCPKCSNNTFEMKIAEPRNSVYKVNFVQCTSCGAVVGVMDYLNIGTVLGKQNEALKRIARALNITVDLD